MIEPFFGSSPAVWPPPPPQGFPFALAQNAPGLAQPTFAGSGFSIGAPAGQIGAASGFPGPVTTELVAAANLRALLSAVAMRRGQPLGPTNDQECEDFLYDAFEWLAGTSDVEVRCEGGRATLTGSVPTKWLKRDLGEIAWAIPGINDVHNNVTIATRRRPRGVPREIEPTTATPARKHS